MSLHFAFKPWMVLAALLVGPVPIRATNTVTVTPSASYYLPTGGNLVFTVTLSYSSEPIALAFNATIPAGWSFVSNGGTAGVVRPEPGSTDTLEWSYSPVPASSLTFSFTVAYPAGQSGTIQVTGISGVFRTSITERVDVPNVVFTRLPFHSADTNGDWRLGISELLRMFQIYSFRAGTIRTGQYTMQTGTEDGYVPGLGGASVTSYHSADSNLDGKISLLELTRVIELYNYHVGNVRTGQYHLQPGTEDGFAPGP